RLNGKGWPMNSRGESENPLRRLEDWEDFVEVRYPAPAELPREDYRNDDHPARDTVRDFYRLNHRHQTYDFVRQKKQQFLRLERRQMTVLEALDFLDTLRTTPTQTSPCPSASTCCRRPRRFAPMGTRTGSS